VEAYAWLDIAGSHEGNSAELTGKVDALHAWLTERMTDSEIAEARAVARERGRTFASTMGAATY